MKIPPPPSAILFLIVIFVRIGFDSLINIPPPSPNNDGSL
jgi:hypothetical protein